MTNYQKLIEDIIKSLVVHLDDCSVLINQDNLDQSIDILIKVHNDDLGRVIGRHGNTINAVRTIVYSAASRENYRVKLEVKSIEE